MTPEASDCDDSCLTDFPDLASPTANREEAETRRAGLGEVAEDILLQAKKSDEEVRKKLGDEKTEALIRAAAKDVLAKMELERAGYDVDSLLSATSGEDMQNHSGEDMSELTHGEGTEISYTDTELSGGADHEDISEVDGESHVDGTEMSYGEGTETSYYGGTEMTYGEDTEISYEGTEDGTRVPTDDGTEHPEDELEQEAGASESGSGRTQRENDDIFSQPEERSGSSRNSLNSIGSHPIETMEEQKSKPHKEIEDAEEMQGHVDHEPLAAKSDARESISPYSSSEISAMPEEEPVYTPSKQSSHRPPFRTPSSVRAIQMSSPTPSVINGGGSPNALRTRSRASQYSSQSPIPSTSRTTTPSMHTPILRKKVTPKLFTAKTDRPLVLLHVTLLPLHFAYSSLLDSGEPLPESIQYIRETWRLLQDKLGDVILNRGILLPHPQESYEVLEEVLLEALELPIRKRGEILKCGHYLSAASTDLETIFDSSESDTGNDDSDSMSDNPDKLANVTTRRRDGHHVCPTCDRTVKIDKSKKNVPKERRFKVKVYASNGLMGVGAWSAAWREMERVDVEIEPFVKLETVVELDNLQNLWSKHVEEMEKREEDKRQREFEEQQQQQQQQEAYEQQEQQKIYEQQQRDYEQQQGYEREAAADFERQAELDTQNFIEENVHEHVQEECLSSQEESREAIIGDETQSHEETTNGQVEQVETSSIYDQPVGAINNDDESVPMEEIPTQVSNEDHLLRQSNSIPRLREIYGSGPEAVEKIHSTHASVANSRPRSRQVQTSQPPYNNGQSSPIPAHALAARLQGINSASHSRSPERLRSRMHSDSPSRASGYGAVGMAPHNATVLRPWSENDYGYGGNRPYSSQDFTSSEQYNEKKDEFMRERLRRRTEEKGSLPPRFGEGINVQEPAQRGMGNEMPRRQDSKPNRNRETDSFLELLFQAVKVAMRDRKNVVILILGMLVLFFALKPVDTAAISQSMGYNFDKSIAASTLNSQRAYKQPVSNNYDEYEYLDEVEIEVAPPKKVKHREDIPKVKSKSVPSVAKHNTRKNPPILKKKASTKTNTIRPSGTPDKHVAAKSRTEQFRVQAESDTAIKKQRAKVEPEYDDGGHEAGEQIQDDMEFQNTKEEVFTSDAMNITDEEIEESSSESFDEMNMTGTEYENEMEANFETQIPERHFDEIEVHE